MCINTQVYITINYLYMQIIYKNLFAIFFISLKPGSAISHLFHVPPLLRHNNVQLMWSAGKESCWAIDHVLINTLIAAPYYLFDTYDPIYLSNWLFMPGITIKV